jgi:hypothetical protein
MNNRVLSLALTLSCASLLCATAQEPPGCKPGQTTKTHTRKQLRAASEQKSEITGKLPKRSRRSATRDSDSNTTPFIASPIYLPSTNTGSAAITESNGFLYVVSGQRLYKVNEKTLKTVQVSALGRADEVPFMDSETPKRKKIVASNLEHSNRESTTIRHSTTKHRGTKTD